jgi:excisionase family DNA binding protein
MPAATATDWNTLPLTLSVQHIMEVLGISRDTAFSVIHEPGFPAFRIGKQIRVSKDGFKRWLEEQALDERRYPFAQEPQPEALVATGVEDAGGVG